MDLPDLLEFANAQFLELRYYDNALRWYHRSFYDEIDVLNKSQETRKVPTYRAVRNKLMEQMADMSVLLVILITPFSLLKTFSMPESMLVTCFS